MKKMFMCLIVTLMVVLQAYGAFAACCFPGSGCSNDPVNICTQSGGVWESGLCGDPEVCQGNGGDTEAVPTMSEWGMIIFMVLAGLGAVYYMRRQRRAKD